MNYSKPKVIAEIGCNHMGDMGIAKELILLAKQCGCGIVKFQKRNSKELLPEEQYNSPHPNPANSYGDTYGAHREFLEFDISQHRELNKYCNEVGIVYSTSVWDCTSAREVVSLNPSMIKVPSGCNNNMALLKILRDNYNGEVHVSFGMTTREEEKTVVTFFEEVGTAKERLVIYSCTSGYPVPFKDLNLLEISRLYGEYGDRVKEIAFSGHHLGIAADIAAYTLGAKCIERHFTKNRTWKGTDHAASLEVSGLSKLVRDLNVVYESLNYKDQEILEIEKVQREKLKYKG